MIPGWVAPAAAALVAAAAWAHGYHSGGNAVQARWDAQALQELEDARELEHTRRMAREKVVQDERVAQVRRAAAGTNLRDAAASVRNEADALARRSSCPAGGSDPAASASVVLADMYRSVDEEAVELAQAYDAARAAGLACQRINGPVTP